MYVLDGMPVTFRNSLKWLQGLSVEAALAQDRFMCALDPDYSSSRSKTLARLARGRAFVGNETGGGILKRFMDATKHLGKEEQKAQFQMFKMHISEGEMMRFFDDLTKPCDVSQEQLEQRVREAQSGLDLTAADMREQFPDVFLQIEESPDARYARIDTQWKPGTTLSGIAHEEACARETRLRVLQHEFRRRSESLLILRHELMYATLVSLRCTYALWKAA